MVTVKLNLYKLLALIYQLMGYKRSDTIEGGIVNGGDVYCITLFKNYYLYKQFRIKLNNYIHTIKL